uniref:Uncharacterized protein n=1 Tax=Anguilla anguilla TaxID=7936 RepID=A0A0E9U9K0_ANGAN
MLSTHPSRIPLSSHCRYLDCTALKVPGDIRSLSYPSARQIKQSGASQCCREHDVHKSLKVV